MDPTIASIIGTITGAIIGAVFTGPVTYFFTKKLMRSQEASAAASKFRSTIFYELAGFFPTEQHWEKNEFDRIYQSIPKISSAAAEFRYFVTSKKNFDKAVDKYNKYCRETTYESVSADIMYPDMRKEGEEGKRENFKNIVEHLLSFAVKN